MSAERIKQRYHCLLKVLRNRQSNLTILADGLKQMINIGAIIRTADAVGLSEVHADFREEDAAAMEGGSPKWISPSKLRASSKGSNQWVKTVFHKTPEEAFTHLRSKGYSQIVSTALHATSVDYREVDYTKPTCVVFGRETTGVSQALIERADRVIHIPMYGMVESLNVSAAAAVVLYEAQRQRQNAGMYSVNSQDDSDAEYVDSDLQKRLLELIYPQVYQFCLAHSLPFPKLGKDGQIEDEEFESNRKRILLDLSAF